MSGLPVTCFQRCATASCTAMPPPSVMRELREVELGEVRVVEQRVEQRVHAGDRRELELAHLLHEPGNVARVGDQDVLAADRHEHEAVRRQREDVIQRQRRDHDLALALDERRLHPRPGLQHVRDDVAVQQHRALRHARRAARVLQERDVVVPDRHALERALAALRQRVGEPDRAGQRPFRDHLLHVPQHEVDDDALEAQHLADRRDDDAASPSCGRRPRRASSRSSRRRRSPRRPSRRAGARARAPCTAG